LTNVLEKQPAKPMNNIFKTRFGEAKYNLEQKLKNDGVWLGFKKEA
jgi:hypothetical protein